MTQNSDGTISLTDVTEYAQVGDIWGAGDANEFADSILNLSRATCEVVNRAVTISASDWTENAETFRIEAKVMDENIHTYSNARLIFKNEDAGKYAISMEPRPHEGYVVLYPTGAAPTVDIEMQLLVEEVRLVEQKS